jgi:hypothetical protein
LTTAQGVAENVLVPFPVSAGRVAEDVADSHP